MLPLAVEMKVEVRRQLRETQDAAKRRCKPAAEVVRATNRGLLRVDSSRDHPAVCGAVEHAGQCPPMIVSRYWYS